MTVIGCEKTNDRVNFPGKFSLVLTQYCVMDRSTISFMIRMKVDHSVSAVDLQSYN